MKKLFCFAVFISLISSVFAFNWFDDRFLEISFGAKYGISNDAMQINDILTKDVVLDLKQMADDMPETGWTITSYLIPELSVKLNLRKFQLEFITGSEVWSEGTLSKDLFDYLGKGNTLYQTVSVSQNLNMDVFAYEEVSVGFKIKKFKIAVKPAIFIPVFHVGSSNGTLNVTNLSDGSLNVDYSSDIKIYSAFGISGGGNFIPGIGIDVAGSVSYPLTDYLVLTGKARIPLIPGHLSYKTIQKTNLKFTTSLDKIVNGKLGSNDFNSTHDDSESEDYWINRPMKFSGFADFTPFGEWIVFTGGLGLGFRHPFTDDIDSYDFFGEYYLAGTFRFRNILSLTFSTEYFEKLFIHQFSFSANARIVELVFGINAQATDFTKSCSGGGIGGLFALKFGY